MEGWRRVRPRSAFVQGSLEGGTRTREAFVLRSSLPPHNECSRHTEMEEAGLLPLVELPPAATACINITTCSRKQRRRGRLSVYAHHKCLPRL